MHWLCLWKQTLVSYWLLFIFTPGSLTAQGLSLQEMQLWTTTCSQVFFDVINNLLFFNFGGDLLLVGFQHLVEIYFGGVLLLVELWLWWSSSSHSFSFCPVVGISFLLLLLLCSPVRCGGALSVASSGSHSCTDQ